MRAIRAIAIILAITALLSSGIYMMRWAKSSSSKGTEFLASAMILLLGFWGPIVKPPQQNMEETREEKGRKGGESGDPPTV